MIRENKRKRIIFGDLKYINDIDTKWNSEIKFVCFFFNKNSTDNSVRLYAMSNPISK